MSIVDKQSSINNGRQLPDGRYTEPRNKVAILLLQPIITRSAVRNQSLPCPSNPPPSSRTRGFSNCRSSRATTFPTICCSGALPFSKCIGLSAGDGRIGRLGRHFIYFGLRKITEFHKIEDQILFNIIFPRELITSSKYGYNDSIRDFHNQVRRSFPGVPPGQTPGSAMDRNGENGAFPAKPKRHNCCVEVQGGQAVTDGSRRGRRRRRSRAKGADARKSSNG